MSVFVSMCLQNSVCMRLHTELSECVSVRVRTRARVLCVRAPAGYMPEDIRAVIEWW